MVLRSSVDSFRSGAQWEVQQLLKDLHLEGVDVVLGPQSNVGFLKKDLLYLFYLFILCAVSACANVHHMHAWRCPQRPEGDVRSPGTEVVDSCELLYKCWQPNLGPLQEEQANAERL